MALLREWPDDVPILSAEHMAWRGENQEGTIRDLSGWIDAAFGGCCVALYGQAQDTLRAVLSERLDQPVEALTVFAESVEQHHAPSKAWQAACWNEMLSRLGFEGLSDDCRKVPRTANVDHPQRQRKRA